MYIFLLNKLRFD